MTRLPGTRAPVRYAEVAEPGPTALTLGGFVEEVSRRYGNNIALGLGSRQLTYKELYDEVCVMARALIGAGVGKGTRVALLLGNRPEWPIAAYAVGMIGGVLIPVNTYAELAEREYILRHSDASILLIQDALLHHRYVDDLLDLVPEVATTGGTIHSPTLPSLRQVYVFRAETQADGRLPDWSDLRGLAAGVSDELRAAVADQVTVADDAIVIYTSGTTEMPKAVLHVQRSLPLQSWRISDHARWGPTDRVLSTYPFFWTSGEVLGLGAILAAGARLVMCEVFDVAHGLELIEREQITVVVAAIHQQDALAQHPDALRRNLNSLTCLRFDSPLRGLHGVDAPRKYPASAYGLSETFTIATSTPADAPDDLLRTGNGRPFPGIEVRVVDPVSGEELPVDCSGEIVIRGNSVMAGYYKVPRDECFDADGFFHTADSGRLDADGYLHFEGRLSGMIKTGGANVSPIEIEKMLSDWGRIRVPMAVGVPHPLYGEAVVVCAIRPEGEGIGEDDVRSYLRAWLASYRVPRRVLFVEESELPLTGTQMKVRLEGMRRLAARILVSETDPPDEAWVSYLREYVLVGDAGASAIKDDKELTTS